METVIAQTNCACPLNLRVTMIEIKRYGRRNWAVYLGDTLLVVAVYKKGAIAVRNALQSAACLSVVPSAAEPTSIAA